MIGCYHSNSNVCVFVAADLTAKSICVVCPIRDAQRREFQYKRHRFYQRIAKRGYGAGLARIK